LIFFKFLPSFQLNLQSFTEEFSFPSGKVFVLLDLSSNILLWSVNPQVDQKQIVRVPFKQKKRRMRCVSTELLDPR